MTRAEQLAWWRQGYLAGYEAGQRDRHDAAMAQHHAACREFRAQRQDDAQARVDALLLEAIDALARAMLGEPGRMESAA